MLLLIDVKNQQWETGDEDERRDWVSNVLAHRKGTKPKDEKEWVSWIEEGIEGFMKILSN